MNGESAEGRGDQTWNRSEKLLLIPLIMHAAAGDLEHGHFGALRWLLLKGPDALAKVLYRSPSDVAQIEFEGWMRLSDETNFKYGVDAMANQLFTFYLAVPSRSRDSKLIGSLMVNFLLDHVLEIREKMKYPLTMLLDEFTNSGKISGISEKIKLV
jgi:hypothetical protein